MAQADFSLRWAYMLEGTFSDIVAYAVKIRGCKLLCRFYADFHDFKD